MSILQELGVKGNITFPVSLVRASDGLRGGHPFAVLYSDNGKIKLRVGGEISNKLKRIIIED